MANQPHPSKQAVTWRLPRTLLDAVKAAAEQEQETVLAFATRALQTEVKRVDPTDREPASEPGWQATPFE